jgi:hypothetical protein
MHLNDTGQKTCLYVRGENREYENVESLCRLDQSGNCTRGICAAQIRCGISRLICFETTGAIKAGVVGATVNRAAKALPKVGKGIVAAGKLGGKVVVGRAVGAVGVLKVEKAY